MLQYRVMSSNTAQPTPHALDVRSHSPAQTVRLGTRLGALLQPGDLVLLYGDFGAGKTHFTKGLAQGLGSTDLVTSPSFVLINEYRSGVPQHRVPIFHIDLYRIEDPAALLGIGLDDALDGHGICIIEWAERAQTILPADALAIHIDHVSKRTRTLHFAPHGTRATALVDALKDTAVGSLGPDAKASG